MDTFGYFRLKTHLVPVILTTWEAEIGRNMVRGQWRQIVHEIYL
jgi:hypothetical protein